jgi:hypothetical protein
MQHGIGYRDYCHWRSKIEGHKISKLESPGYERYAIYFGRTHLPDFESGVVARGWLKIGQAKYVNTVQRGRNQGGSSFRVYSEITLENEVAVRAAEAMVKSMFSHMHIHGDEGQTELYKFNDPDIPNIADELADAIRNKTPHIVKDVVTFMGGKILSNVAAPTLVVSGTFDTMFDWANDYDIDDAA